MPDSKKVLKDALCSIKIKDLPQPELEKEAKKAGVTRGGLKGHVDEGLKDAGLVVSGSGVKVGRGKGAGTSKWIAEIKKAQADNNCSYKEAIIIASQKRKEAKSN